MVSRIVQALNGFVHTSEFTNYCERIQLISVTGGPTADEARKDYQALLRHQTSALAN